MRLRGKPEWAGIRELSVNGGKGRVKYKEPRNKTPRSKEEPNFKNQEIPKPP
jgi:hypothetical protein